MSEQVLVLEVRLLNNRWHGDGDWPPAPFRLYQALIAGAFGGRWREAANNDRSIRDAFRWLEHLEPPLICAPSQREARPVQYFVPNNDLDAVGSDPRRSPEIRSAKLLRSRFIDGESPFIYAWRFDEGAPHARRIVDFSERMHTFGRGLDPAYARGFIETPKDLDARLSVYEGSVARPDMIFEGSQDGSLLPCPISGSLDRLDERYAATTTRLQPDGKKTSFRQPPKPLWQGVRYGRNPRRLVFELRQLDDSQRFYPVLLTHALPITKAVRDLAAEQLRTVDAYRGLVDRLVVGRNTTDLDRDRRVRCIPLPSIGTRFTDQSIRRIVVELPPDCPISEADMHWAVSGRHLGSIDMGTGEIHGMRLVDAADGRMLSAYASGTRGGAKRWQTVTPAALPTRRQKGLIGGVARVDSENAAARDVLNALRHAGIRTRALSVRVQREPFSERGQRVEAFAADRFGTKRLYHVEIIFAEPVCGPLLIGDGRWLGLGLLQPLHADSERLVDTPPNTLDADAADDVDSDEIEDDEEADDDT